MTARLPFNWNETVRVRLTPQGLRVMRANRERLLAGLRPELAKHPAVQWRDPEIDAEGYTTMPLWQLAEEFGHVGARQDACFEFHTLQLASGYLARVYRRSTHGVW